MVQYSVKGVGASYLHRYIDYSVKGVRGHRTSTGSSRAAHRAAAAREAGEELVIPPSLSEEKEEARELDLTGKGVVRVRLHGAHDLKPSDDPHREDRPWLGKKDLSDPYCTLGLHETEHRGTACHKTNPSPDPDPKPDLKPDPKPDPEH